MKDPEFDDKVGAMNLASELAVGVLRLYQEGPAMLQRTHAFPSGYSLADALKDDDNNTEETGGTPHLPFLYAKPEEEKEG